MHNILCGAMRIGNNISLTLLKSTHKAHPMNGWKYQFIAIWPVNTMTKIKHQLIMYNHACVSDLCRSCSWNKCY